MKRKVRILCVVLAALLAAAVFAACGGKKDDGTNTLEIARWDMSQVNTAKKQGTALYKAVKEATGVDITVMSISNAAYDEKLNMLYASEDLPDVFVSTAWDTPSRYRRWIRDGAIINFNDYVSETEYPNIYARLQQFDFLSETLSYARGGHYAIPIAVDPIHRDGAALPRHLAHRLRIACLYRLQIAIKPPCILAAVGRHHILQQRHRFLEASRSRKQKRGIIA